jgi:hypothetical protein
MWLKKSQNRKTNPSAESRRQDRRPRAARSMDRVAALPGVGVLAAPASDTSNILLSCGTCACMARRTCGPPIETPAFPAYPPRLDQPWLPHESKLALIDLSFFTDFSSGDESYKPAWGWSSLAWSKFFFMHHSRDPSGGSRAPIASKALREHKILLSWHRQQRL